MKRRTSTLTLGGRHCWCGSHAGHHDFRNICCPSEADHHNVLIYQWQVQLPPELPDRPSARDASSVQRLEQLRRPCIDPPSTPRGGFTATSYPIEWSSGVWWCRPRVSFTTTSLRTILLSGAGSVMPLLQYGGRMRSHRSRKTMKGAPRRSYIKI